MILALVSQKGGSSKSTLAISIGWELAARGSRVLLVDSDPQQSLVSVGNVESSKALRPTIVSMLSKDLVNPQQLPLLAKSFDHVIIDTPGRAGDVQNAALMVADTALIPVGQSALEMWAIGETLGVVEKATQLKKLYGGELKAAIVVTRKAPRTALGKALRKTLAQTELPLFTSETTQRVAWQECIGFGLGVAQYAPKDPAAKELRALVDELLAFADSTPQLLEASNG